MDDFILSENLIVTVLHLIYAKSAELTESDYEHFILLESITSYIMYLPCFCFPLFWVLSLLWR